METQPRIISTIEKIKQFDELEESRNYLILYLEQEQHLRPDSYTEYALHCVKNNYDPFKLLNNILHAFKAQQKAYSEYIEKQCSPQPIILPKEAYDSFIKSHEK